MNQTVYNERVRSFATFLNTIAAASISIGILAPFVAALYGVGQNASISPTASLDVIALGAVLWLFMAGILHVMAQVALGNLI